MLSEKETCTGTYMLQHQNHALNVEINECTSEISLQSENINKETWDRAYRALRVICQYVWCEWTSNFPRTPFCWVFSGEATHTDNQPVVLNSSVLNWWLWSLIGRDFEIHRQWRHLRNCLLRYRCFRTILHPIMDVVLMRLGEKCYTG